MEFFCGFVVRFCGFDFVFEVAEVVGFFVVCYLGGPFIYFFVPMYAFVAGAIRRGGIYVFCVLGEGTQAEVFLLVV